MHEYMYNMYIIIHIYVRIYTCIYIICMFSSFFRDTYVDWKWDGERDVYACMCVYTHTSVTCCICTYHMYTLVYIHTLESCMYLCIYDMYACMCVHTRQASVPFGILTNFTHPWNKKNISKNSNDRLVCRSPSKCSRTWPPSK